MKWFENEYENYQTTLDKTLTEKKIRNYGSFLLEEEVDKWKR
jgi:hypothetical protein